MYNNNNETKRSEECTGWVYKFKYPIYYQQGLAIELKRSSDVTKDALGDSAMLFLSGARIQYKR